MHIASSGLEAAIYRLLRAPGLDAAALGRVLSRWREEPGTIAHFWGCTPDEYRHAWGLTPRSARFLAGTDEEEETAVAEATAAAAQTSEIELVSLLDPPFGRLAVEKSLPSVLFTRGNQDFLWHGGVAIPHSRDATEAAIDWGALLAAKLTEQGVGLVTGHNRDGYRRVAAAGKKAAAPLTVVLDRPLHGSISQATGVEPVSSARLWDDRFRPERELLVSELPPAARWVPAHSHGRDRLIVLLAEVIAAGDVRPGGTIATLCGEAAAAGRAVFRTPFCRASLDAPVLPSRVESAAGVILGSIRQERAPEPAARPRLAPPEPGWVKRRWDAEAATFVEAIAACMGREGWVAQRALASLHEGSSGVSSDTTPQGLIAIVRLPVPDRGEDGEAIFVGQVSSSGAREGDVLLLSPGEPIRDLAGLRAYLGRCRERVKQMIRARLR